MAVASLANERSPRHAPRWQVWLSFVAQIVLVVALGSVDDLLHALTHQNNAQLALANAARVEGFEAAHGLWVEPAVQAFFTHAHDFFGTVVGYAQLVPLFNAIYGLGHVGITLAFAVWMFLYRRPLFAFVRNIFVFTNALAILTYEVFPLAPPRLANALRFRYDGNPYHFIDTVFGSGGSLKLDFNEFAAMPSLHVGWALIVSLTVFMVVRPLALRVLVLLYPVLMLTTVIVTGNHYVADGLGALAALGVATTVALSIEWWRSEEQSLITVIRRLNGLRYSRADGAVAQSRIEAPEVERRTAA
jgi:hypothetical protein